jgi:hypothetical protein
MACQQLRVYEINCRIPFEALDDDLFDMHCEREESEDARSKDYVGQSVTRVRSLV